MTGDVLWILVPLAPLLLAVGVVEIGDRVIRWWWISALPGLLVGLVAPAPWLADALWPGTQWGDSGILVRSVLLFTTTVWLLAGLYAMHSLADDPQRRRFWLFWLFCFSGNLLLIISGDALSFYVGFSVMSLAAYGLIVHRAGPGPRKAGRLYLQIAVTGELLLFTGFIMASHQAGGSMALEVWQSAPISPMALFLMFVGLGMKAGFWPLHVWLPQAHPVAPAPASAVLSGAMIKAGILGMWKLLPTESPALHDVSLVLMIIGLISAFYGVVLGLGRSNVKEVLAFSSVSQMGYMLLITGLLWHSPALAPALTILLCLYMVHHGFCKAALFLAAELFKSGRLPMRNGHHLLLGIAALPAIALAGLPLSSGAAAKSQLKEQLEAASLDPLVWVLQIGAIATALLLLRALHLLRALQCDATQQRIATLPLLSWLTLALMPLVLPWLWPLMREASIDTLPLYKLAELAWPLAAALLITALVMARGSLRLPKLANRPTPFVWLSLRLKRVLQRPPVPVPEPEISEQIWRNRERRWNRFWHDNTVRNSSWLLLGFLMVASIFFSVIEAL